MLKHSLYTHFGLMQCPIDARTGVVIATALTLVAGALMVMALADVALQLLVPGASVEVP